MTVDAPPGEATWRLRHQPFGAQLMGAAIVERGQAHELLFASARPLGPGAPVRGGVPVMFPQFNDRGPLPKHGLVRTQAWQAEREIDGSRFGETGFAYRLDPSGDSDPRWPHRIRLMVSGAAQGRTLMLRMTVANTGHSTVHWTGGLHPYFAVQDVLGCRLSGLEGYGLADCYQPDLRRERGTHVTWSGAAFERLYDHAPPLLLEAGRYRLRLSCSGFEQWMVWNPGEALSQTITDLSPGDWRRFVCIEPVVVTRPNRLGPGEIFSGELRIEYDAT